MSIKEIESLKPELGEDYLEKEKQSDFTLSKEIIVAIENQKPGPAALDFTGVILYTLRCNKIHS